MAKPSLNFPLTLSLDTRGVAAQTNHDAGKDQRRVNCEYVITRTAVDAQPDVVLAKCPGVTADAGTYGAGTQVQYLVGKDPASTWEPTPWVFVKDGNNSKAVTSATATTILNSADYYPRFWDVTDVSGTNTMVVQLQNSASPSATPAQKVYYSTAIATFTEISDGDFTALSHRGKMEFMDGYAFIMDSRCRIYQSDVNSLSAWGASNYISMSSTTAAPQGIIKGRSRILAFTTDHCEAFRNEGNPTGSVLSRIPDSEVEIGLGTVAGGGSSIAGKTSYYARIGDLIFFVGRYGGGQADACLIAWDGGLRFQKVSRPHEDTMLSTATIYSVNSMSVHGKPCVAIQLTSPDTAVQKFWCFYPDINEGFFMSRIWSPVNNGRFFAGTTTTTKLYYFGTTDVFQDDSNNYTMTVQFRLPIGDHQWKKMSNCGVIADTLSSGSLAVSFIDDDSGTPNTARNIDLSKKQKMLHNCGMFRERFVRMEYTGSLQARLRRFYADVR